MTVKVLGKPVMMPGAGSARTSSRPIAMKKGGVVKGGKKK